MCVRVLGNVYRSSVNPRGDTPPFPSTKCLGGGSFRSQDRHPSRVSPHRPNDDAERGDERWASPLSGDIYGSIVP